MRKGGDLMNSRIQFTGQPDGMFAHITDVPGFKNDRFDLNFPEAIGSTSELGNFFTIKSSWKELANGDWQATGKVEGLLEYTIDVKVNEDTVDFYQVLTNRTRDTWAQTMAFNCFDNRYAVDVRDFECKRHWVRTGGEFRKLIELPRVFGPRPALQLYSVEGAPPGKDIPFVKNFESTPDDLAIEGWMAIRSRDDKRLVATVSKPALFTFQNREYSCIHSAPSFGIIKPGESGRAFSRLYFVEASLEDWYQRMQKEMADIDPGKAL
jgi:hypothetical protein